MMKIITATVGRTPELMKLRFRDLLLTKIELGNLMILKQMWMKYQYKPQTKRMPLKDADITNNVRRINYSKLRETNII